MAPSALIDALEAWMKERYPTALVNRELWANHLDTGPRPPYRDVELRTVLADWHLYRPPLPSEVSFRLRRNREGLAVSDEIEALRGRLRAARAQRDADPQRDADARAARRAERRPTHQPRLDLPREPVPV